MPRHARALRRPLALLTWAAAVLASAPALACLAVPPEAARDPKSLVAEARAIVLVTAQIAPDGKGCELRPLRYLKGAPGQALKVHCRLPDLHDQMTTFSAHNETEFWNGGGRVPLRYDCTLMAPAFKPGKLYLFLVGIKPDIKQYEQIVDASDSWMQFVQKQPSVKI